MVKPSFIPPPDIRQLRDLMRCDLFLTEKVRHERNKLKLNGVLEIRVVN